MTLIDFVHDLRLFHSAFSQSLKHSALATSPESVLVSDKAIRAPQVDAVRCYEHRQLRFHGEYLVAEQFTMPHSGLKKCHIVAVPPLKEGWEFRKVKEWVDHAGGKITFQPEVDEQTTHIVIGEKKWRQQDGFVMSVLDHKQQTGQQIDIVNYDWLEKSLEKRSKKREGPYCWEKMDKNMMRARHRSEKEQAKLDKANNPRTTSGLMKEVFTDSTDAFVDEKEKRRMERRMIEEEKLRKEAEDEKKQAYQRQRDQMRVKEVAAVFRRGVQKSRNELLSGKLGWVLQRARAY